MAVITFLSDFGTKDHYVAAVKSQIIQVNPALNIIDISHDIQLFDLSHASFVMKHVYRDFPKGTVHLLAVDSVGRRSDKYLAFKVEEHYFICPDNGLISLITDQQPTIVVDLNTLVDNTSTFPAKDVMAPAAAKLCSGSNIHEMGKSVDQYIQLIGRKVKATKKEMAGNVVRVDHYGNLITNIKQSEFEKIHSLNDQRGFSIRAGREVFHKINNYFYQVDPGDCYLIFNSNGLLQIGINKGDASRLLGLQRDAPISINFIQA
ncbi:MAG: SAM-dependent chlorinase/fluorinase [Cyclobacteriaceae bacterium]